MTECRVDGIFMSFACAFCGVNGEIMIFPVNDSRIRLHQDLVIWAIGYKEYILSNPNRPNEW